MIQNENILTLIPKIGLFELSQPLNCSRILTFNPASEHMFTVFVKEDIPYLSSPYDYETVVAN
jgi:hypothetical protein